MVDSMWKRDARTPADLLIVMEQYANKVFAEKISARRSWSTVGGRVRSGTGAP
jgi:hypothetical protein